MSKLKKSKPFFKKIKQSGNRRLALALVLVFIIVTAVGFIGYTSRRQHREAGQYNITDVYPGENLAHSLDLKLAAKATYNSAPLGKTQDLGDINGLPERIVNFQVKTDNLTEYAMQVLPSGAEPAQGYPVLILLHGFSAPDRYSTETTYLADMEAYARAGFAVIKPDYRGQGLSVGAGLPNSAYYSMDYNTDVMSLISAVRQTSYLNKNNVSIWGHSMGAYIGLRASVLSKNIKNLILLAGPVDSLKEMYLTYIPPSDENNPYALATRNQMFAKYGTPAEDSRFWYDASPTNYLSQIKARIQIHVGLLDHTVPPKFSADLDQALTTKHIVHSYFAYPTGLHSLAAQKGLIYSRSIEQLKSS